MMFNHDSPFGSTIFCDDIRNEIGGKTTFIGVYHGIMYLHTFPANIPKFGISVYFNEPKSMAENRTFSIQLKIFSPNSEYEPLVTSDIPALSHEQIDDLSKSSLDEDPDIPRLVMMKADFTLSPLVIERSGRLKVRMSYGDDIIKLGSIRIELLPEQTGPGS